MKKGIFLVLFLSLGWAFANGNDSNTPPSTLSKTQVTHSKSF
jgi:hypothetical protein